MSKATTAERPPVWVGPVEDKEGNALVPDDPIPPTPYYNARIPDERFRIPGDRHFHEFRGGRFLATTLRQEAGVRGALRNYGPDKPDRWSGDDMDYEFICPRCKLRTNNRAVEFDHKAYGICS